ncbi:MAG TPA: YIP1 family protein [Gemmatimonadales bacterium]|nr:YIP1 family protein [Gemmatimonadales bacterium]
MSQPSVQPAQQSVMGAVLDSFNVLHEPTAVFTRVKERPRILVPWLVISVFLIVFAYFFQPFQNAAMEHFKATLPPEQAARMGAGGNSILGLLIVPVFFLIGLAVASGVLSLGVLMTGGQARYKTLMSVLAYSCSTYAMSAIVVLAVLMTRGVSQVVDFGDLRAPIGLDVLAPGVGLYLGAVLNSINPFAVWGVWLVGTGISVTHGVSRAAGIVITSVAYVFCLFLQFIPLLFLSMAVKQ